MATNDLISWFTNNDTVDCPIVDYQIYETQWDEYKQDILQLQQTGTKTLQFSTRRNIKQRYMIRAMTRAKQYGVQYIDLHVCGQEWLNIKQKVHLVVMDQGANGGIPVTSLMSDLVESSDASICPITSFTPYTRNYDGDYIPYTGSLVQIDNTTQQLEIQTAKPGSVILYAKTITLGNVIDYVPIEVEICGGEEVSSTPGKPYRYEAKYLQKTGQLNIQKIRPQMYMPLV